MNAENEPDRPTEAANADEGLVPKIGPLFKGIEQPLVPKIGPIIETAPMMRQLEAFARGSEALRRQMEPFIRGNEALQRQVAPIAEAAAQLARIGPWPKIGGSLALPLSLRLAAAVDADMRDLLPAHEPVVHQMTLATTLT